MKRPFLLAGTEGVEEDGAWRVEGRGEGEGVGGHVHVHVYIPLSTWRKDGRSGGGSSSSRIHNLMTMMVTMVMTMTVLFLVGRLQHLQMVGPVPCFV